VNGQRVSETCHPERGEHNGWRFMQPRVLAPPAQRYAPRRPAATAIAATDGRVYVEQDGSLHEFSNTGGSPSSIAIDHLNQLYVCDLAHGAVILIKDDGSQVVVHDYEGQAFKVRNGSAREVCCVALPRLWAPQLRRPRSGWPCWRRRGQPFTPHL
jgi:hypothetical protein